MVRTFANKDEKLDYRVEDRIPRCWKCNKILTKEDKKFGCERCNYRKSGFDVPQYQPIKQKWVTRNGKRIRYN